MLFKLSRAVCLAAVVAAISATSFIAMAETVMTHHLQAPLRGTNALQPVGKLASSQVMTLDVVLPLRDPAGLNAFLADIYNPKSSNFHLFLTPDQFAARFGPTQADYDTVVTFLKDNGFNVYGGTFLGHEIQVKAPVSTIEAAFHISMYTYQHPTESRTFYSPDREPTPNVSVPIWHISGLDNFSIPKPKLVSRNDYAKAHGVSPDSFTPRNGSGGSGPGGGFLGSDMRAAYYSTGPGAGTLTGAGQNLGLFEFEGTNLADLTTYFTNVGQTNTVPITLLSTDGSSVNCTDTPAAGSCDDGEQTLDMTQALGMAPGLASLTMYIGNTDTPIISAMTTHSPLPTTIGCSWGWTPADPTTLDPYFLQMSAQGQNFFAAAGDHSTWTARGSSAAWPADDANIVSVGGSDLYTQGPAGPWDGESTWVDGGGGISPDHIALPSWQNIPAVIAANNGNGASSTLRNGPDVTANANFTFYTCVDQEGCQTNSYGGTSFAAPMWAGYVALVNQGLKNAGLPSLGFMNPTIYAMNVPTVYGTSTYGVDFHDITSGTSGSYSAELGFDLVSGWGSPTPYLVPAIIEYLSPDFSINPVNSAYVLTTSPSTPSITDTITLASTNSLAGTVALTCAGSGGLTCTVTSPATLTANGTATVTLSVNGSAAPVAGTYAVTVKGTLGTDVHTAAVDIYTPGSSLSIKDGSNGSIVIAAPGSPGSTALTLTPAGFLSGVTTVGCTITSSPIGATVLPTCAVTPTSVTLAVTTPGAATLTINTIAPHLKQGGTQHSSISVKHVTLLAGGLFLALLLVPVRRRHLQLLTLFVASAMLLSNVVGCSSTPSNGSTTLTGGTTTGSYVVTVTGTVGTVTATHNVAININ